MRVKPRFKRPYIYHDDALRLPSQAGISVSHREGNHFVWASDYAGEVVTAFLLTFDDSLNDTRVVGSEVHEAVGYACLYRCQWAYCQRGGEALK